MRVMLDENVPVSVAAVFRRHQFTVKFIRELIPQGSVDELVAFVSEQNDAILASFDGDFKRIAPRIPDGQRRRFRKLSRIFFRCPEHKAAGRLEKSMSLLFHELEILQQGGDPRMILEIGNGHIKTQR